MRLFRKVVCSTQLGIDFQRIMYFLCSMYFKVSMRKNPDTGSLGGYYRLIESYRNHDDRVCHRTLLNVGFLQGLQAEQLKVIQTILTEKAANKGQRMFSYQEHEDPVVNAHVEMFYNQMVDSGKIDTGQGKKNGSKKDLQLIDVESIKNKDVREIGAEWLICQALEQLQFSDFLSSQGWKEQDIKTAQTHIISRAVHPASELGTVRWVQDNSAVCELTGIEKETINKDKLYRIAHKLYQEKEALEQHLSKRTNELFDIEDKIVLYDLTNTYFEGRKQGSNLAAFGRSKEKRSDAPLVVLALVVNPEGFIKYSGIFQGNIADCKTLSTMIDQLRIKTSSTAQKALVVIDAGIATEENLEMIQQKGYDYLCVNRCNLKEYTTENQGDTVVVKDNKKQKIELTKVSLAKNQDYYLRVKSEAKEKKERSMNRQFRQRFEQGLETIAASLTKKGGIKQEDKVNQRIGRLKQKYPSIQKHFDITTTVEETPLKRKKKGDDNTVKRTVTAIQWSVKQGIDIDAQSGIYFLRTSLKDKQEELIWKFYNTIREIEATFRVLKTDLDLRPIYHKNDDSTMAHLHLGLLAYWAVNTIRFQLKNKGINSSWKEIVRVMNTQKMVSTVMKNDKLDTIMIRKCSEPSEDVKQIYSSLNYKITPFRRKKFVVHNTKLKKNPPFEKQGVT